MCLSVSPDLLSSFGSRSNTSVEDSKGTVMCEPLRDVVKRDKYLVNNYLDNNYRPRPVQEIIKLAKAKVGESRYYHLLLSNCEHFATELRYGMCSSQQVRSRMEGWVKPLGVVFTEVVGGRATLSKYFSCLDTRTGHGNSVPH